MRRLGRAAYSLAPVPRWHAARSRFVWRVRPAIRFLPQTAANIATADAELVTYRRATRREELPPGSPVLLGFLEEMAGYEGGKPYLRIEAWCPACRRTHTHGWCEDWDLDTIHHKTAHCPLGTVYRDRGYHVGLRLDESAREYNRQVLAAMGG